MLVSRVGLAGAHDTGITRQLPVDDPALAAVGVAGLEGIEGGRPTGVGDEHPGGHVVDVNAGRCVAWQAAESGRLDIVDVELVAGPAHRGDEGDVESGGDAVSAHVDVVETVIVVVVAVHPCLDHEPVNAIVADLQRGGLAGLEGAGFGPEADARVGDI